jgi:hypothetical protein
LSEIKTSLLFKKKVIYWLNVIKEAANCPRALTGNSKAALNDQINRKIYPKLAQWFVMKNGCPLIISLLIARTFCSDICSTNKKRQ